MFRKQRNAPDPAPDDITRMLEAQAGPAAAPYFPGTDPDGKPRLPPFAGRYAAADSSMPADIIRPDEDYASKPPAGAVQRSPFV